MNKKKIVYIFFVLALLVVPIYSLSAANDVSITADTNIVLTNPSMTLILASGSSYSSMTVTASSVAFTVSASGTVTLKSNDSYTLTNDQNSDIHCPSATQPSYVTYSLAAGAADSTITFTPTTVKCYGSSGSTSGGSVTSSPGGGGGGTPTPAPADTSTGQGETTSNISAGQTGNMGQVSSKGSNVLMGEGATANFSLSLASGGAVGSHSIKVQNITGSQATFTISSSPVVFTLVAGSSKNVDIDADKYRDMRISLNRIVDGKADITVKEINVVKITKAAPGSLVKIASKTAVYYLGEDSKRYVFPHEKVYYSWYNDFSGVITISDEDMAKLPIGGLVTYRPGTRMVTFVTTVDVYAVTKGGVLRKLKDEAMAKDMYGDKWNQNIDDVNDAFYPSYSFGADLASSSEYNKETEKVYTQTITVDKNI